MPWDLNGNNLGVTLNEWLGTRDAQPLIIGTETGGTGMPTTTTEVMRLTAAVNGRRVGIGTTAPQRRLHVEPSEIHSGGGGAGFSFGNRETAAFTNIPGNGERWVWYATGGTARLWSGSDKLAVLPNGNLLLNGGVWQGEDRNVPFPAVPIGGADPAPGELVLGGVRTSIRGFDGIRHPSLPGEPIRLGAHRIRTNGREGEWWIGFVRGAGIVPVVRRLEAPVSWWAPSFNETSDARLKTNVRQIEGALDKLERIRGVAFEPAETESPYTLQGLPEQPSLGVVAQEVEEVFPEVVSTYEADQEYMAVHYGGLTSVLIEAVKELKAQNEELQSRIEALEGT